MTSTRTRQLVAPSLEKVEACPRQGRKAAFFHTRTWRNFIIITRNIGLRYLFVPIFSSSAEKENYLKADFLQYDEMIILIGTTLSAARKSDRYLLD